MPSRLKRYQHEGHYHFLTFSCYRRLAYLDCDRTRIVFEEILERVRRRHITPPVAICTYAGACSSTAGLRAEAVFAGDDHAGMKDRTSKLLKGNRTQLWQRRYYDFNVMTYKKYVEKLRYMHRNPVKRGLVEKAEDWPWSSYRHYLTGQEGRVEIRVGVDLGSPSEPTHDDGAVMNGAPEMKFH